MVNANSLSKEHPRQHEPVYDVTPFSALDYPEHLSAIIWFAGCNMRCSYCYNGEIVFSKGRRSLDEVLTFLQGRTGLLDGVVLSGGEATMFKGLPAFCQKVKALDFKIKLDTNGTNPEMIETLLKEGLLDHVALDYKAPSEKFSAITGHQNFTAFEKSLELLIRTEIALEVRTTLHSDLLDEDDISAITVDLKKRGYSGTYYVQRFVQDVETIGGMSTPVRSFDHTKVTSAVRIEYRQ